MIDCILLIIFCLPINILCENIKKDTNYVAFKSVNIKLPSNEDIERIKEDARKYGLNLSEDAIFIVYVLSNKFDETSDKIIDKITNEIKDAKTTLIAFLSVILCALIGYSTALLKKR